MSQVVPITAQRRVGEELLDAIDSFLGLSDFRASTRRVYERTLEGLVDEFGGHFDVAQISRAQVEAHLRERYGHTSPATYNRHLATISSLFSWCEDQEVVVRSPASKIRRRKARKTKTAERQGRAIPLAELKSYWTSRDIPIRERVFVAMAYDTAARASELLGLDVGDLELPNKQAVVIGKGGDAERIFWSSVTARLLPRLIAGRTQGPLFLADLAPVPARQPAAADLCPETGRAASHTDGSPSCSRPNRAGSRCTRSATPDSLTSRKPAKTSL